MVSGLGLFSFATSVVVYTAASALFYVEVLRPEESRQQPRSWAPALLLVAAAVHAAHIVHASFIAHICPVVSTHFFLSIASLLATGIYLAARRRFRIHAIGLIVAPVGLVVTLSAQFYPMPKAVKHAAAFIGLHVFPSLCGAALFLLASGAAVLYLIKNRRLKNKHRAPSFALPPLDVLDRAEHWFLLAGFPLLTLSIATGSMYAAPTENFTTIMRTIFGWATWLVLGTVLLLRVLLGWRGRRSAYGTLAGFACAIIVVIIYLIRPWLGAGG